MSPSKHPYPNDFPKANWTIIIFMAAESNLGEDMKDSYDQIANIGSNLGEVNFVVLFDGIKIPKQVFENGIESDNGIPTVYYVTRYNFYNEVSETKKNHSYYWQHYPKRNDLTNKKNLVYILKKIKKSFPANNYGFIYKGHGGREPDINNTRYITRIDFRRMEHGREESFEEMENRMKKMTPNQKWKLDSICGLNLPGNSGVKNGYRYLFPGGIILAIYQPKDEKKQYKQLSYYKLSRILKDVFAENDKKLGFVCLDCCWGQLFENGASFKDTTEYLVGSADEMPVLGIGYGEFCEFLVKHPLIKPDELANAMVAIYFKTEYNDYLNAAAWYKMGVSLTCVKTSFFDDIKLALDELCEHLIHNLRTHFYLIHKARLNCIAYTFQANDNKADDDYALYNIDLIWFLENLRYYNLNSIGEPIDAKLDQLIVELVRIVGLYYIKSYMASNYADTSLNLYKNKKSIASIGGKGIGISFPSKLKHYENSIYYRAGFFKMYQWKNFLIKYVAYKLRISKTAVANDDPDFKAFTKYSVYDHYLNLFNHRKDGTLKQKLVKARRAVMSENLSHKWIKRKRPKRHRKVVSA